MPEMSHAERATAEHYRLALVLLANPKTVPVLAKLREGGPASRADLLACLPGAEDRTHSHVDYLVWNGLLWHHDDLIGVDTEAFADLGAFVTGLARREILSPEPMDGTYLATEAAGG